MAAERDRIRELETERQKLYANLIRWLKINFSEIYSASLHIKALRVFVESVLRYVSSTFHGYSLLLSRYGLPVNFEAMIIHPTSRKSTKRLRDALDQLFGYLDQSNKSQNDEVETRDFSIQDRFLSFCSKSTFRVCSLRNKNTTHTSTSK